MDENLRKKATEIGNQLGVKMQIEDIKSTHRLLTRSKLENAIPPTIVKLNNRYKEDEQVRQNQIPPSKRKKRDIDGKHR